MHRYFVRCDFDRPDVATEWLRWLRDEHVQDMLKAGATRAEIVKLDGPVAAWQIAYDFPSYELYEKYLKEHADGLQEESLGRFPPDLGLRYERSSGEVIAMLPDDMNQ